MSLLIVDDNPNICRTLKDIFNAKGFEVEVAYSGMEALSVFSAENIDCVLTDIRMPSMNGVELYRALKQIQIDIPVVLMTAYSTDDLVKEGLREGALVVLTKPLDIDNLIRRISAILNSPEPTIG